MSTPTEPTPTEDGTPAPGAADGAAGSGIRVGGVEPTGPYHRLRIARVVQETADARSLVLEIPESLRDAFSYRAGQFLTFRVPWRGGPLVRCYSLSSSPVTDPEHKVTVKRVEGGRVSNWMNDVPAVGDELEVMRPAGLFCLRERATPLVLFAGGSGITPVISILKTALAASERAVRLLYANRNRESIIFRDELAELEGRHRGRLRVDHRLDDVHGFADREAVLRHVGEAGDADFYICGPAPFMDLVEGTLGEIGVDREQVFIERFEASGEPAAEEPPPEDAEAPEAVEILLDGQTHTVPIGPGETLLQAARRAGLDPPFSCEEGYCSCCMARLEEGEVHLRHNECLDARQRKEGWILTCQGVPRSRRCRIRYPD